jgi:hypothetical protein
MSSQRVRVSLDNLAMGLKKAEGLLFYEQPHLMLELQEMDAILELVKEEVKTYKLPLKEIDSVSIERKWFKYYIEISAKNMRSLQHIPGTTQGMLKLSIKRDERESARTLVSHLQLLLSEQKLQELDQ